MTTITIDNPQIEKKYSAYEIQLKFCQFLIRELQEDRVELYQIAIDDLPEKARIKLKTIDSLRFVEY